MTVPSSVSEEALLSVVDIKQFIYCPRILFHTRCLGIRPKASFLMSHGAVEETVVERRQRRQTQNRFGLPGGRRWQNISIVSDRLGLVGKIDLLVEGPEEVVPVDFKAGREGSWQNHRLQLAAYGMLAEEKFGKPCRRGFLFYSACKRWVPVELEPPLRQKVLEAIHEARQVLDHQVLPEPTPMINRCVGCEFLNFCGDRW